MAGFGDFDSQQNFGDDFNGGLSPVAQSPFSEEFPPFGGDQSGGFGSPSPAGFGDVSGFGGVEPTDNFGGSPAFGGSPSGFGADPSFGGSPAFGEQPAFEQPAFEQPAASFGSPAAFGGGFEEPAPAPVFASSPQPEVGFGFESPASSSSPIPQPVSPGISSAASPYDEFRNASVSGSDFSSPAPSGSAQILRQYEEEHQRFIQEKVAQAERRHQQIKEEARQEFEAFKQQRQQHTANARARNAEHESNQYTDRSPANDQQAWANLRQLAELSAESPNAHTERMRGVLNSMYARASA